MARRPQGLPRHPFVGGGWVRGKQRGAPAGIVATARDLARLTGKPTAPLAVGLTAGL